MMTTFNYINALIHANIKKHCKISEVTSGDELEGMCVEWGSSNTAGTSLFMKTKISTHIEV